MAASRLFGISICLIYNIFGIPCPSCGMTRAWAFAIRGDLWQAFFYHPLFWSVTLLPLAMVKAKWVKKMTAVIGIAFIVTWVIRLIIMFPHTEPMVINGRSLLFTLIR